MEGVEYSLTAPSYSFNPVQMTYDDLVRTLRTKNMEIKYMKRVRDYRGFGSVEIEIGYTNAFLLEQYNIFNANYITHFTNINPQLPAPDPAEIGTPDYYENLLQYGTNRPPAPPRETDGGDDWFGDIFNRNEDNSFGGDYEVEKTFRRNLFPMGQMWQLMNDENPLPFSFEDLLDETGDVVASSIGNEFSMVGRGVVVTAYGNRSRIVTDAETPTWGRRDYLMRMQSELSHLNYTKNTPQSKAMIDVDDLFRPVAQTELIRFLGNLRLRSDQYPLDTHGVPIITV